MSSSNEAIEKKKFKVPHSYVIIFCIVLVMAVLTYIVPAGEYARVEDPNTGRTVVDPASYELVEQNPITFFELWKTIPRGMVAGASIIFFMFVISGAFGIIQSTGSIEAVISRVALKFRHSGKLLIPIILVIFSIFGATIGMAEETIIFVPLGIALARALKYDAIVGTSIILLGAACGFLCGAMNPFTVGVAQGLAELPIFSGIGYRIVMWVVFVGVTAFFIIRYANKIEKDPSKSRVLDLEQEEKGEVIDLDNLPEMRKEHVLVMLTMAAGFAAIIYGVFEYGWYITEISAAFLITGIAAGFLGRMGPSRISKEFVNGAKDIVFGALIVGIARAILLVMQDGLIMDTIIFHLANLVQRLPSSITASGMYVVQCIVNFFIPSGSGQAAVTMPIMVPLADVTGINRQIAVLAFQLGDGISNSILPQAASCMGALSVAHIPWEKWARWFLPLIGVWYLLGLVFMVIAQAFNYGPF